MMSPMKKASCVRIPKKIIVTEITIIRMQLSLRIPVK